MEDDLPPPYTPYSNPPPLPPRNPTTRSVEQFSQHRQPPQSYFSPSSDRSNFFYDDPRTSSQASLPPAQAIADPSSVHRKRTLMLIYIHGFMGDETSFQSFPVHVHNLLTVTLGSEDENDTEGYLVHTKVYPKFKTRHNISVATEKFSVWLSDFESPNMDIILLGHSMGGILAAEVVLLTNPQTGFRRHPGIIGSISFDTPFLGMHPGVIVSGIGSLFRKNPAPSPDEGVYEGSQGSSSSSSVSLATQGVEGSDGTGFDQRPKRNFSVVERKKKDGPWWDSPLHFIEKYHNNLTAATGNYLMSHLEFGGCLADPVGLKNRYARIRKLEDGEADVNGRIDRARFINYYTSSTGRLKKSSPKPEGTSTSEIKDQEAVEHMSFLKLSKSPEEIRELSPEEIEDPFETSPSHPPPPPPPEKRQQQIEQKPVIDLESDSELQHLSPEPISEASTSSTLPILTPSPSIPPPPPPPQKPERIDLSNITDASFLKSYEKQFKNLTKEYERATKSWEKATKQHHQLVAQLSNPSPSASSSSKNKRRESRDESIPQYTQPVSPPPPTPRPETSKSPNPPKPGKERRFCILPWEEDKTWVKVDMVGVDEVGAHCGLFSGGEVYGRLVGDVVARVEDWVGEERSRRVAEGWGA
ncbi:hypothetical protein RUND412_004939 [Rhizina undulata]